MSGLIWVQTVCKDHQQKTKFATGSQRVNDKVKTKYCVQPNRHTTCLLFKANLFVCVDALFPNQEFFSQVGMMSYLPELNQYLAEGKVSYSKTQHSASSEY